MARLALRWIATHLLPNSAAIRSSACGAQLGQSRPRGHIEGGEEGQTLARRLGAEWAGSSTEAPPEELDGAIVFAPVGPLMTAALRVSAKGARIVSAGIHMSDIPSFPYEQLWGERSLSSVANLTRRDGEEFLALAPQVPVRTEVELHPLEEANEALASIRDGALKGAAVLRI